MQTTRRLALICVLACGCSRRVLLGGCAAHELRMRPVPSQPHQRPHGRTRRGAGAARHEPVSRSTAYFREAATWDADRAAQAARSARRAWQVGGRRLAVRADDRALALALLMPLKRVEPFVVRVDSTTGVVDVVPVYAARCAARAAQ